MSPNNLNGLLLICCLFLTGNIYQISTKDISTTSPTATATTVDNNIVIIPENEYEPGPSDYNGDPCTGAALFEGDIAFEVRVNPIINTTYILYPTHHDNSSNNDSADDSGLRRKRGATSSRQKLWDNAIVYFEFASSISERVKDMIYKAMRHWEEYTCVRFRQRTTQYNYIEYYQGLGCCSFIGNLRRGRQLISIGRYCHYFPSIVHEIGHVLGFWHEMNRPDRDEHIEIKTQYIPSFLLHNFNKLPSFFINSRGVVYDYNSIMHYSSKAFSTQVGQDTIVARQDNIRIGPDYGITKLDAMQTNIMYSCTRIGSRQSTLPINYLPLAEDSFNPSCGQLLNGKSGYINYNPSFRGSHLKCEWLILVPVGYSIILEFRTMSITKISRTCHDNVEVKDGNQLDGVSHGKYCGTHRNYRFLSSEEYMHVVMNVESQNSVSSFYAVYTARDVDECRLYVFSLSCQRGCTNFPGGFTCECFSGYHTSHNNKTCLDDNECAFSNGGCDHKCINTGGSYECECYSGYYLESNKHSCNSGIAPYGCRQSNGGCEHICTTTDTSNNYVCDCNTGYSLKIDLRTCEDIDECRHNFCNNSNQYCTNTIGSYYCSCNNGYTQDLNDNCLDINECENNPCDHICINTDGGYICSCYADFRLYNYDQKSCYTGHCQVGEAGCSCFIQDNKCVCLAGYQLGNAGSFCQDVDECAVSNGGCQNGCVNTPGSYTCSCSEGFEFRAQYNSCHDINECNRGTDRCEDRCRNTQGSYICSCSEGYQLVGDKYCDDIDECLINPYPCGTNMRCNNLQGAYSCECYPGYSSNSQTNSCEDNDECALATHSCQHICENQEGSYACNCNIGYEISNFYYCTDIDECESVDYNVCYDDQLCKNTDGSYDCICKAGLETYQQDGLTLCRDMDECFTSPCDHSCTNTDGSFYCSCDDTFLLDRNGLSCLRQGCSRGTAGCYCITDSRGRCVCEPGYELGITRKYCQDANECEIENGGCPHDCVNTIGSFYCSCPRNFVLSWDLKNCIDELSCDSFNAGCEHICSQLGSIAQCSCNDGYLLNEDNKTCSKVPGCYNNGGCNHICTNINNIGVCSCYEGYYINITDKAHCISGQNCTSDIQCGHYCSLTTNQCACKPGFFMDSNQKDCIDINECELANQEPACSDTCLNTEGSYKCTCSTGQYLASNKLTCLGHSNYCRSSKYSRSYGYLPIIRHSYLNNPLECLWRIDFRENRIGHLRLSTFVTYSSTNCEYFSMEIWDSQPPYGKMMARLCSSIAYYDIRNYYTYKPTIYVKITIQPKLVRPYYIMQYRSTPVSSTFFGKELCTGSLRIGQNFTSQNFPNTYLPNSLCYMYVTAYYGQHIRLRFYSIDLESSPDCSYDSITVYSRTSLNNRYARQLAKLCGNEIPTSPIYNDHNQILIVFKSDSTIQGSGFYGGIY